MNTTQTHAQFHYSYLKTLLAARNIRYSKTRPNGIITPTYLQALIKRVENTNHLPTFQAFINFCKQIKAIL